MSGSAPSQATWVDHDLIKVAAPLLAPGTQAPCTTTAPRAHRVELDAHDQAQPPDLLHMRVAAQSLPQPLAQPLPLLGHAFQEGGLSNDVHHNVGCVADQRVPCKG